MKFGDSGLACDAEKFSASLALRFFESSSKLLNVLARRLPIGIAGIAVKLERTSAQGRVKLIASEGDRLVVIIGARYVEFGPCGHSMHQLKREEIWFGQTSCRSRLHQPVTAMREPRHIPACRIEHE